ncbi:uncharacterized protein LOC121871367 [Homarus americanus]|uniref:uncharacterized protein LOC121871367 n=1 Tax=Homarus americanus TaxID=6706 RepID=UPI001C46C3F7|nr:uncharacterized protein LOC121871367 [Homarus americanus]
MDEMTVSECQGAKPSPIIILDAIPVLQLIGNRKTSCSQNTRTALCVEEKVRNSESSSLGGQPGPLYPSADYQLQETDSQNFFVSEKIPSSLQFPNVTQNKTLQCQEQETQMPSSSKNIKLLNNSGSENLSKKPHSLWQLSSESLPDLNVDIVHDHIKWFRALLSEQCKDIVNGSLTFSEHKNLVIVETCIAQVITSQVPKSQIMTTEYLFSQVQCNFVRSIWDLKQLLAKSPLFVYNVNTQTWNRRRLIKETIPGCPDEHWDGIRNLRNLWTFPESIRGVENIMAACLKIILSTSLMSMNQICHDLCSTLCIPWSKGIVEPLGNC